LSADEKLNAVLFHLAEPAVLQWHVCNRESPFRKSKLGRAAFSPTLPE
jgi:hypothetical protein